MAGILNAQNTLDFLGTLGTDDKFDKVRLSHTARALVAAAGFLIGEAENNLQKKGSNASGKTSSSMQAGPLQTNATKMQIDIEIASTYKFLDAGVKGTQGGTGKYSFKNPHPSEKMAKAIRGWLRLRRVATKYKAISRTERKNKRIKKLVESRDGKLTALSYAIATNIKKKGIKPTHFFSKAIKDTRKMVKSKFPHALKLDIIEALN